VYPFEVYDENTKRVEFYFNLWQEYKDNLFKKYPLTSNKRVLLDLINPADRFKDVKTHDWNPHANIGNLYLNNKDCFYCNDDWSVLFDVYPAHNYDSTGDSLKFFAELTPENPAGEKVKLLSTSSNIDSDSSIRYAYFRNKFWLVSNYTKYPHENYEDCIFPKINWSVFANPGLSFPSTAYNSPTLKSTFKSSYMEEIKIPILYADTIFYSNETQEWYSYQSNYTILHRSPHGDLPAVVYPNGDKEWWVKGKRHREKGPAIIIGNKQYWYRDGIYLGDKKPS
jgi:hypothetical protein